VAPLLVEAGWFGLVDEVWVTVAPESQVIERVRGRDGLDADAIMARVQSQISQEERLAHADAVIDNGGGLDELRDRVRELWRDRVANSRS
jgi:dephospho-CoA kinase